MVIRDVIHGSISIDSHELPIIDSQYFQRLRHIRQAGFAENSFPSATHNRFIHSLGAMEVASRIFDTLFQKNLKTTRLLSAECFSRFRATVRLAALLHDIGHGPLSHTTEFAMPDVRKLKLPIDWVPSPSKSRQATHEDYTLKMILDSGLTAFLNQAGSLFGFKPVHVAGLIDPKIILPDNYFIENSIDYRPILTQIISSELDADRMDYLRRDSLHTGVSYGQFDFDWLVNNLTSHTVDGKCYLSLHHRALYAFEDFLLSRFHMFLMVYFHHKSVVYDEMLAQYFSSKDCDYILPSDIEHYCEFNDAHLYAHLAQSSNEWAQRITNKKPYLLLVELHSNIPATKTARVEQEKLLAEMKQSLSQDQIHYLQVTSTSELSKYFRRPGTPIFVCYNNHFSTPNFIPIEQCTDLFQKYAEKRSITRLYVSPENLSRCRSRASGRPLQYEDNHSATHS
jgi:HD superfamily phosphohydrolase